MEARSKTGKGVGARLLRKEDDRYMRGRGKFIADIRLAGMKDVAFLRSPLAYARLGNQLVGRRRTTRCDNLMANPLFFCLFQDKRDLLDTGGDKQSIST